MALCGESLFSSSAMSLDNFSQELFKPIPTGVYSLPQGLSRVFPRSALARRCSRCCLFLLKDCANTEEWKRAVADEPARARDLHMLLLVAALPTSRLRNSAHVDYNGVSLSEFSLCYKRKCAERGVGAQRVDWLCFWTVAAAPMPHVRRRPCRVQRAVTK